MRDPLAFQLSPGLRTCGPLHGAGEKGETDTGGGGVEKCLAQVPPCGWGEDLPLAPSLAIGVCVIS